MLTISVLMEDTKVDVTSTAGKVESAFPSPNPLPLPCAPPDRELTISVLKTEVKVEVTSPPVEPALPLPSPLSFPEITPELPPTLWVLKADVEMRTGGGVWIAPEAWDPKEPPVIPEDRITV